MKFDWAHADWLMKVIGQECYKCPFYKNNFCKTWQDKHEVLKCENVLHDFLIKGEDNEKN